MTDSPTPNPGDQFDVRVEKLVPGGHGLARHAGVVFFIDNALPEQLLRVEVSSMKKRHGRAVIREILEQAPEYVVPACPDFGQCGGCAWQHLAYGQQLFWKEQFVRESLQRIGNVAAAKLRLRPIIASPETWFYRNKMEFAFAPGAPGDTRPRLGLKMRGSNALVEVAHCRLQSSRAMEILGLARNSPALCEAPVYDPQSGSGFWRYLVLRENGREMTAQLITTGNDKYTMAVQTLAEELMQRFSWLTGFVHAHRDNTQQVALAERTARIFGKERLDFTLGSTSYAISSNGFFQPNTSAAACMYDIVAELAGLEGGETVWDLYCGAGGAGLHIARNTALLAGFDISRDALADAALNARQNNIPKARFHPGDMRRTMRREKSRPDVLLTDPPRSGMAPEVVEQILAYRPQRIVSVACDPATQARDIGRLAQAYDIQVAQPVDMFPHTPHVENIVLLHRRDS